MFFWTDLFLAFSPIDGQLCNKKLTLRYVKCPRENSPNLETRPEIHLQTKPATGVKSNA